MQSDNQLIRKILRHRLRKNQGREAADELTRRYYKELYAYVFRQTGSRELAMDLTQEIFIQILQKLDAYNEKKAGFRTWAYRIASNRITDYYRSLTHRMAMLVEPLPVEDDEVISYVGTDIEKIIIQRELICQVMAVVAQYPSQWVQIFQKKCFEEMTFAQIAESMELSVNTVKTRFYHMVKKIRQEVEYDG